jgi:glyoxylase-like metal-dependent hydrolase (beta-lactamase superfamily II)
MLKCAVAGMASAALAMSSAAIAAEAPAAKVKLWRLECGKLDENRARPWPWQQVATPTPCFLIANGGRYLLWDAGLSKRAIGANHPVAKLERTISDHLAQIAVRPEQVEFVGISHYHGDHTGQATQFPKAKLLIGAGDFNALKSAKPPQGAAPTHIQPWIDGKAPVELLTEDRDVFGDGSVQILMTPGHTPGHSSLLVKLASGPVILTGDLWFSHSDALRDAMPDFNTSRAETIASRERIARLAEKLDAVILIQHEPDDVDKLPAFPKAAE